jgi:tetratricopeptide (TPR) repeat protein
MIDAQRQNGHRMTDALSNSELSVPCAFEIKRTSIVGGAGRCSVPGASILALILASICAPVLSAEANPGVDVLADAMQGEFALQSGVLDEAARGYADAAVASSQVALIERAATVALYAKDYAAADRVGARWLLVDPPSIAARRTLAWSALATGRVDAADEYLSQLAALRTLEAQRAIAQVLVAVENREHAPASLRRMASAGELLTLTNGPVWSAVAGNLGEFAVAVKLAQADTAAQPKSAEAWRRSAQALLAAGDRQAARKALERALELAPKDFELRLALASVHADAGRRDLADKVLAQAKPQGDRALAARLANVAGEPDAQLLKRIERELLRGKPAVVTSRAFLLGQLYELREQPDQALSWYAQEPAGVAWHESQLRRSVLLATKKNDIAAARAVLADLRRQVEDSDQHSDAWLLEAELLAAVDRKAALAVYDAALAQNSRDIRLLYARALFRMGDDDVAGLEQDLRSLLSIDPENAQALNALGYTLADRTDRHQEALDYIRRAIAKQPDDAAFLDSMGWVQYRLGNFDEALRYLRRAFELVEDGEIAAHLGEALWSAGQRDEAQVHWRGALKRWPDHPVLIESLQRLQPGLLP